MPFDGTLKFDTAIDQTGFKVGLKGLGGIASAGMKAIAGAVTAATGTVTALGTAAIKVGSNFETGMSQVQATLGLSIEDVKNNINGAADTMDALTAKAEEMGATTAFTAAQAAEGLNILAMSGYDAQTSIDMIGNVLDLAAAGGLSLADAAGFAAGAMKGFANEATSFSDAAEASAYYADRIAKGATLAATDVYNLGAALSDAAASATAYGQSSTETEVALLRLAEQGVTGTNASTALAAAMKNLYAPTDQAAQALEALGVNAYDNSGNVRAFNTVVDELNSALASLDDQQKTDLEQTIFGIQGKDAFDKMVVSSAETVQKFYDGLGDASGSAAQQASTMLDNLTGDMTLLQSAADGLYNAFYKDMNAPLRDLAQTGIGYLSDLTDAFDEGGFEGAAAAIGDILSDGIAKASGYLPDVVELGTSILESLLTGLNDHLSEMLDSGEEILGTLAQSVTTVLPLLMQAGVRIVSMLGRSLLDNLPLLLRCGGEILGDLIAMLSDPANLTALLDAGMVILDLLAQGIEDNLPALLAAAILILQTLGVYLAEHADELVMGALALVQTLLDLVIDNLPLLLEAAAAIIVALCDGITEHSADLLIAVEDIVMTLFDLFHDPEVLGTLWKAAAEILKALIPAAGEAVGDLTMFAIDLANRLGEAIAEIDWAALGLAILEGICSGLMGEDIDLKAVFSDFKDNWVTGIKDVFGIHSPSKLMRDEVGKFLGLGTVDGFLGELDNMGDAALDALRGFPALPDIEVGLSVIASEEIPAPDGKPEPPDLPDPDGDPDPVDIPVRFDVDDLPLPDPDPVEIPVGYDVQDLPDGMDVMRSDPALWDADSLRISIDPEALQCLQNFRVNADAVQALRDAMPSINSVTNSPVSADAASITNTYYANNITNNEQTVTQESEGSSREGDIIIPVTIGGQNLDTIVLKAAQIANARSGGATI